MKLGERSYRHITNQGSSLFSPSDQSESSSGELSSSLRHLPLLQPISRRLIQRVRGAHAPWEVQPGLRPAPSAMAPPRRGRGLIRLLSGREVWVWFPRGSCVLRRGLPIVFCSGRYCRLSLCLRAPGCRGQSEHAFRRPG